MRGRGYIYQREGCLNLSALFKYKGRRHYKGGFPTRDFAQTWIDRMLFNIKRDEALGIEPLATEVTFAAFLPRWKSAVRPTLSDTSYESYVKLADGLLLPHFGAMMVHEINPSRIHAYMVERAEAGASASTINRNLNVLASIMMTALASGCTRINPVVDIKRARETIRPMPYLTHEDELRLLAALPAWLRTAALVSLEAGLRQGEIVRLTRRDIDFQRKVLVVRISKNRTPRMVGLNPRLAEALAAHLETIPRSAETVFAYPDGSPIPVDIWRNHFPRAAEKVGMRGFRFHDLRHMHGTRLAERGAPPAMIKMALGHKCLAATLRYIDHAPTSFSVRAAFLLTDSQDPSRPDLQRGGIPFESLQQDRTAATGG